MSADGMNYAPQGRPAPVCGPGEFVVAACALDHGHIFGMCNGLTEAGAEIRWVHDPDPAKVANFIKQFPSARPARSLDEILDDPEVRMVAAAAVPNLRGPLGCQVMRAGRDYFTDKTPFTSFSQLDEARKTCAETGRKYMVYYSERLHNESAVHAGDLVRQGAIGRVVHVMGLGPHRRSAASRPAWFFEREKYGGILCDIGSHQCEQFLYYTGARNAQVVSSAAGNFGHPEYPELEDFGECSLTADNGASGFWRVDWFTPDGLRSWGDGRTFILGTHGFIELRKYIDITTDNGGDQLLLVDGSSERRIPCKDRVGYPFFGRLIRDCLERTETAMTQEHAFKAAELCLQAQAKARRIGPA
ncbi:MAG: Gfo/Idh/MocA family oxidoreductase [Terrimicrobiaceae bacterium]|nr:Gfo/Idh/MocA family oxidoreductase [Terrimicrobiaceae bacterium]